MTKLALAVVALCLLGVAPSRAATALDDQVLQQVTAGGGSIATKNTAPYVTPPKGVKQPVVSATAAKCQCGKGATFKAPKK